MIITSYYQDNNKTGYFLLFHLSPYMLYKVNEPYKKYTKSSKLRCSTPLKDVFEPHRAFSNTTDFTNVLISN